MLDQRASKRYHYRFVTELADCGFQQNGLLNRYIRIDPHSAREIVVVNRLKLYFGRIC